MTKQKKNDNDKITNENKVKSQRTKRFKMSVNNSGLRFISLCLFSMVVVTAFQPRYYQLDNGNDASTNCTNCKANMSTLGNMITVVEFYILLKEICDNGFV